MAARILFFSLCGFFLVVNSYQVKAEDHNTIITKNIQKLIHERACIKCNLQGANLNGMNLKQVDLTHANLNFAQFNLATLRGANLQSASLLGTSFKGADISEADFRGADTTGTSFSGAYKVDALFGILPKKAEIVGDKHENRVVDDNTLPRNSFQFEPSNAPQPKKLKYFDNAVVNE